MKRVPNKTLHMVCEDCGHKQDVTSATAYEDMTGQVHYYFGSSYDFCDECDGLPLIKEEQHGQ